MKYYKQKIIVIINCIMLNICICNDTSINHFIINKKFKFKLEFEKLSAGNAFISINEKLLDNKKILDLTSKIKTNRFFDFFYKIRDEIYIDMNIEDFSLLRVINKIREGKYKKDYDSIVNINSMEVITNGIKHNITDKIFSPLSIIFSLRNKQLNINDVYNYSTYSSGKIKNINISVIGYENINTPFGIYESIVLSPKSSDGKSAIKNKGDMKIWLTNDEKRLPIKIEVKLKHGSIVLLLNDIES